MLYQKIPIKVAAEWDTDEVGNVQVDYVEHCGRSSGGQFLHTVSVADIASGWWEGEAIPARTQEATREARSPIKSSRSSRGALASVGEKIAATIVNVTWTTTSAMTVPSKPEKFEPPCGIESTPQK